MIIDAKLGPLATSADLDGAVGIIAGTNYIDLTGGGGLWDPGSGCTNLAVVFTIVDEACAGVGSLFDFRVFTNATADGTTPNYLGATGPLLTANLPIGAQAVVILSPHVFEERGIPTRYLGVECETFTTEVTAGKFDAELVLNWQGGQRHYPSGFTF